ncbi:MAG: J domain-containing protein [Clostridiales bacterium]|jgi:DnaJ-domain-containing protein 1|nr:J domain-containing protein [Clostridiales bacterium]
MIGLAFIFIVLVIYCIIKFIMLFIPKSPEERVRRQLYEDEQARRRAAYEDEQTRFRTEKEYSKRNAEEEQTVRNDTVSDEIQKCFTLFELPCSATFDDVKKKYRVMMKLFHPDKHSTDDVLKEFANKKAKELNNAFNTLKSTHFKL